MKKQSTQSLIQRLQAICNVYTPSSLQEKHGLLKALSNRKIEKASELKSYHNVLCFLLAFPDHKKIYTTVHQQLDTFEKRVVRLVYKQKSLLDDSGISGTHVYNVFSFPVTRWIVKHDPQQIEFDWDYFEDPNSLDAMLIHTITNAEEHTFNYSEISSCEWLRQAKGKQKENTTDATWCIRQFDRSSIKDNLKDDIFNDLEIPFTWNLSRSNASITKNRFSTPRTAYRNSPFRKAPSNVAKVITKRVPGIKLLPARQARRMIDVAIATLAARHREIVSFNYAEIKEVYCATLSRGVSITLIGNTPPNRLFLEGNYGFLILSNGVPIGYGGVSPLFHQANTGINVFEQYRGSEAAYLFIQTLRVFHTLFGCSRFIVDPYQFGSDNVEAISSGAFWFYYKMGFRPVDKKIAAIAQRESIKIKRDKSYRTQAKKLLKLAKCDLHLTLPGARKDQYFPEAWLGTCAEGITQSIADQDQTLRANAIKKIVHDVSQRLQVKNRGRWPSNERRAFEQFALIVNLLDGVEKWSMDDKRCLVKLMRAKGKEQQQDYIKRMTQHENFRKSLSLYCKKH